VTPDPEVRAGRTLDLSVGPPSRERRKPAAASLGAGPVVRETLDLSTKTVAPEPTETAPAEAKPPRSGPKPPRSGPKPSAPKGGPDRKRDRGKAPASASSSLADLLDPDVLAKLRGG